MQFGLSDEQQLIVDTVKSFVENEIYPYEDEVERIWDGTSEIQRHIISRELLRPLGG